MKSTNTLTTFSFLVTLGCSGGSDDAEAGDASETPMNAAGASAMDSEDSDRGDAHSGEQGDDSEEPGGGSGLAGGQLADSASRGCGKPDPGAVSTVDRWSDSPILIDVNGTERGYALVLPDDYDPNRTYGLVFGFHGFGSSPLTFGGYNGEEEWANDGSQWNSVLGENYIVVLPNGSDASARSFWENEGRRWSGSAGSEDVAFFDALYEHFTSNYCIDTNRVFAGGMSNGGSFTSQLACLRGDVLRAVAPNAGSAAPEGECVGEVAMMLWASPTDDWAWGAAGDTVSAWTGLNGCEETTGASSFSGLCEAYGDCSVGYPVEFCSFEGGHTVPEEYGPATKAFFDSFE